MPNPNVFNSSEFLLYPEILFNCKAPTSIGILSTIHKATKGYIFKQSSPMVVEKSSFNLLILWGLAYCILLKEIRVFLEYSLFYGNIFNRLITNNNSINAAFNSVKQDLMIHLFYSTNSYRLT